MKQVHVNTGRSYDILIERGLISNAGDYIRPLTKAVRAAVISDTNVAPIYADRVIKSLEANKFKTSLFTFEAGEPSKRLSTIESMYEHLINNSLTRTDIIIALGGGVTGDMAGFAAASYLRGIDFVQIPTSLLAQVDSSVGGKTGVDLEQGKNLVGAFWQPRLVLIDPDTLNTLPEKYFKDGLGEVIKYGCIRSNSLFERLERENAVDFIDDIIYECVFLKRDVVELDERDTGVREQLNFGHTLGHAIEKLSNYEGISHGEAVSVGSVLMARAGERNNLTQKGTAQRIANLLEKYSLPTQVDFTLEQIAEATKGDKKSKGKSINLILLKEIGICLTHKISQDEILNFISE